VKVRSQRGRVFPIATALVVVLGVLMIAVARDKHQANGDTSEPKAPAAGESIGTHWHTAFGIYNCGQFLQPVADAQPDVDGIHTHQDGIIHIHPFDSSSRGRRAKLGVFFDQVNIDANDDRVKVPQPDGTTVELKDGAKCGTGADAKDGNLKLIVWDSPTSTTPKIYEKNIRAVHFDNDRMVMTLALVPDDVDVNTLKPPSVPTLDQLSDVGPTAPAPSPTDAATTVPGAATTVAPAPVTTVKP